MASGSVQLWGGKRACSRQRGQLEQKPGQEKSRTYSHFASSQAQLPAPTLGDHALVVLVRPALPFLVLPEDEAILFPCAQIGPSSSSSLPHPTPPSRSLGYSESCHHDAGVLENRGRGCWPHAMEVHKDRAGRQEPARGQEGQRDDLGGGVCQLAQQAAGRRLAGSAQALCYLTSLSLAFFPSVGNSPPLGAQKLRKPLPEARRPQGRRSGMVLSLP